MVKCQRKQLIQKVGEKWGNTEEININDDEEEINNDEEEIKVPIPNEYKDDVDRINNIMQDLKKQIDERESWDTFSETISRNYQETTLLELVTKIESDNNLPEKTKDFIKGKIIKVQNALDDEFEKAKKDQDIRTAMAQRLKNKLLAVLKDE